MGVVVNMGIETINRLREIKGWIAKQDMHRVDEDRFFTEISPLFKKINEMIEHEEGLLDEMAKDNID